MDTKTYHYNDFATLGPRGLCAVAAPEADTLARWVAEGWAHYPHPDAAYHATYLPHRWDTCTREAE